MREDEKLAGRRVMGVEVQEREDRKVKSRWLDRIKANLREMRPGDEV